MYRRRECRGVEDKGTQGEKEGAKTKRGQRKERRSEEDIGTEGEKEGGKTTRVQRERKNDQDVKFIE